VICWEYRHYVFEPGDKRLEILNRLGAEGWEAFYFTKNDTTVLFKRQKPIPTEEQSK
jgi:hypothetical protein